MMDICNGEVYRTYISFDAGVSWSEIKPIAQPKIKWSLKPDTYIYRSDCETIEFMNYENQAVCGTLLSLLNDVNTITSEMQIKVDHYEDGETFTQTLYRGFLPLSAFKINEDTGLYKVTPKPKDNYHWWDKYSEFKFVLSDYMDITDGYTSFEMNIDIFGTETFSYHWVDLMDVIDLILSGLTGRIDPITNSEGNGVSVSSQFFKNNPNPVNTRNLTKIAITPLEDVTNRWTAINAGETPPASTEIGRAEVTLKDILDGLNAMFNVFIAIRGTSFLIEHQIYFEQGSYVTPVSIAFDFTNRTNYPLKDQVINDRAGNETDNEYEYIIEKKIPYKETFEFGAEYRQAPGEIRYVSPLADQTQTIEHKATTFAANVLRLRTNPGEFGTSNFVIAVYEYAFTAYWIVKRDVYLNDSSYAFPVSLESNYPNGDLFWDNLLNDFWVYYRQFTSGYINNTNSDAYGPTPLPPCYSLKTFTQKQLIRQRDIIAPYIDPGISIDSWPYYYFKTNMSDTCKMEQAELNCDTGMITYVLIHL